jgi:hypothetical protein
MVNNVGVATHTDDAIDEAASEAELSCGNHSASNEGSHPNGAHGGNEEVSRCHL